MYIIRASPQKKNQASSPTTGWPSAAREQRLVGWWWRFQEHVDYSTELRPSSEWEPPKRRNTHALDRPRSPVTESRSSAQRGDTWRQLVGLTDKSRLRVALWHHHSQALRHENMSSSLIIRTAELVT